MLNEKDGLFKIFDHTKFCNTTGKSHYLDEVDPALNILCDSFNNNEEVAGLLKHVGGDATVYTPDYSTPSIFGVLSFAKVLLINLSKCVDLKIKKEGVIRRTILSNIPFSDQIKKRIEKLPLDTTAEDVFNCFKARNNSVRGLRFHSNSKSKYDPYGGIYINAHKIYKILCAMEKVGSDDCSLKIIQNAIKEVDEVLKTMLSNQCVGIVYLRSEAKEADAMADNTQTLTINRPKQQENKIITVGNKKAYQVGKGDYQHRNGRIIEEEKKEMSHAYTYPIEDKNILADLEDLLNNVIDNPDVVDTIVDYLAENSPAAHFISEMVGCGEISNEESIIEKLNKAIMMGENIINAGRENVHYLLACEYRVYNYLNVDYPKPIFGKEFSLKQLVFCFAQAARNIDDIFNSAKAKEELEEVIADAAKAQAKEIEDILDGAEEEEKEGVITHDAVQNYAGYSVEELEKLLEARDKEEAEIDAEIKQAEEEARRKELVEQLLAKDKRIAEKKALRDKLRGK